MATIHFAHREITAKVVYFGGPGAGSNTNVRQLYGLIPAREKSRLHHFGPPDCSDESWYFEYVPPRGGTVPGFATRFRVYSMPGAITNRTHRREVFQETDAVVFVADARSGRTSTNREALSELVDHLRQAGREPDGLPIVVQVNHTDAPDAREVDDVLADLDSPALPVGGVSAGNGGAAVAAVARSARGVLETHDQIMLETASRLRDNLAGNQAAISLVAAQRDSLERDEEIIARHLAVIEAAAHAQRPSLEMAVQDLQVALSKRYQTLTPGPRFEVAFQPREFIGTKPVHLIESRLEGDQITVDVVMERIAGGEPRRLAVVLANRPADATPVPRNTVPGTRPRPITGDLPDKIELPPPEPTDFPPVWYGIAGLAGGLIVGALAGFLLFG